jgi:hypothetical protein
MMTTIDQISKTTRTHQDPEDSAPHRPTGRMIVSDRRLGLGHDRALGDFAAGQRTYPDYPVVCGDFATGMRTIAKLAAVSDFATGMRTFQAPAIVGDFATGMRTEPVEVRFLDNYVGSVAIAA